MDSFHPTPGPGSSLQVLKKSPDYKGIKKEVLDPARKKIKS